MERGEDPHRADGEEPSWARFQPIGVRAHQLLRGDR
jgi:hypothetical protein